MLFLARIRIFPHRSALMKDFSNHDTKNKPPTEVTLLQVSMRPLLEHPLLEPFEPKLKALLEFAFDGGIRSLEAPGYKFGDDLVNHNAREHFQNSLFSAF